MTDILFSIHTPILVLHFGVCIFLIIAILLQSGKGGDVGGIFGSGSSSSLFGARGAATLLSKLTTYAAILFLLTSLSLTLIAKYEAKGGGDVDKLLESEDTETLLPDAEASKGAKDVTQSDDNSGSKEGTNQVNPE